MALTRFKSELSKLVAQQIEQLKAFAISYANKKANEYIEYLKQQCPPPEILAVMVKVVDKLNFSMNLIDNKISKFSKLANLLDPPIVAGGIIIEIIKSIPIPVGPQPEGLVQRKAERLQFFQDVIFTVQDDKKAIQDILRNANGIFDTIKAKLAVIESILQRCADSQLGSLSDEERQKLINSIQGRLSDPAITGINYIASNGRAYTLLVLNDESFTGVAPRRYAVARDTRGIVVLQGPKSFASSEQVLIDEIKLRIDNQLP